MHVAARTLDPVPRATKEPERRLLSVADVLHPPVDFFTATAFTAAGAAHELRVRWSATAHPQPFLNDDKPKRVIRCPSCSTPNNSGGTRVRHATSDSEFYIMRCACGMYTIYVKAIFLGADRPRHMWSTFPGSFAYGGVLLHTMADFGQQLGAQMLLCDDSHFDFPHKEHVINFRDLYTLRDQAFRTYYTRVGFTPTIPKRQVAAFDKQLQKQLTELTVATLGLDLVTWANLGFAEEPPPADETLTALFRRWLPEFKINVDNLESFHAFFVALSPLLKFKLQPGAPERNLIRTLNSSFSYLRAAAETVYAKTTGGAVVMFAHGAAPAQPQAKRRLNPTSVQPDQRPTKRRKPSSVTLHFIG
jgi:hypothetical protein